MFKPIHSATRLVCVLAFGSVVIAQTSSSKYPQPRKTDTSDNYFGTKIADPYRWMEDLNSPELKQWIEAENAITFKYLDSLPIRDALKARLTELYNYPRVTPPRYVGRHFFYNRNTGLQKQSVVFTRETLSGPETVVIDPNQLSPDGSTALSEFDPAPDGQHFAYGQAEGGSDWSTFYVREFGTNKQLPDEIKWVKFSNLAWTEPAKGSSTDGIGAPSRGARKPPGQEDLLRPRRRSRPTALSTSAGRPDAVHRCDTDATDASLLFASGTSRTGCVKDRQPGCRRTSRRRARCIRCRRLRAARRDQRDVVSATDREAPNKKIVPCRSIGRTRTTGRRSFQSKSVTDSRGWCGKLGQMRPSTGERSEFIPSTTPAGKITPPGLGRDRRSTGRYDRPEFLRSPRRCIRRPCSARRCDGQSTPFEPPKLTFDPPATTGASSSPRRTHPRADVHHAQRI